MMDRLLSELRFRLRAIFRRDDVECELEDELRFHLEHEAAKYERDGQSPDAARRSAQLAFGGLGRIKDDTRDARGIAFVDALWNDVRYTLRGLRMRPGFTAGVVITLGLGIGINAAMFGVLDRLLLRAPEYLVDPARVNRVYLSWMENGSYRTDRSAEYARYVDLGKWTTRFDAIAAFSYRQMAIGEREDVRAATVGTVSASYFDFFAARPALGRFFSAAEDATPAGARVAVLAYGFWQTRYAGRADVIGATLKVDREAYTIIGVAPNGFEGVSDQQTPALFVPITTFAASINPRYYQNYNWGWLQILVRRKPGVSVEAATADLTDAYRRSWVAQMELDREGLDSASVARPRATAEHLSLGRGPQAGPESRVVVWVSGVAVLVLLVACAN
ncbi:MAG TPA: ABC transporter permease, partial [Gemmatimonadaceae bacterium]